MPELPEVETVRRGLDRLLVGLTILAETHDTAKSFPNADDDVQRFMIGAHIQVIKRRAKVLIIELSSGYSLVIHLKMTGQLVYRGRDNNFGAGHPSSSLVGPLPDKSTRVSLELNNGARLFFNDQRKFGWMRLVPTTDVDQLPFMLRVGPEPLHPAFSWQVLQSKLAQHPNVAIKAALLDQTVLAGIGNIYADESLWGAHIHPRTPVKELSVTQLRLLQRAIVEVLTLSIEKGGSTDKNYVDAEGKRGSYLSFANVFRREGQPCPRCGTTIQKIRVAGRGTHLCPTCQQL